MDLEYAANDHGEFYGCNNRDRAGLWIGDRFRNGDDQLERREYFFYRGYCDGYDDRECDVPLGEFAPIGTGSSGSSHARKTIGEIRTGFPS